MTSVEQAPDIVTPELGGRDDNSRSGEGSRLVLCGQCDLLLRLPPRVVGQRAHCPRCHHHLSAPARHDFQALLAWALAALVTLGLVFCFPFLSFSSYGIGNAMGLADTAAVLASSHYGLLALLLLATTVIFPCIFLAALVYICLSISRHKHLPGAILLARILRPLEPWMMSDVFIVGVLVSLIKIISLASIQIHIAFVAFCIYALMLLKTLTLVDWIALWDRLAPVPPPPVGAQPGLTGQNQSLVACRACDTPFVAARDPHCPRCGRRHFNLRSGRIQLTWALLVTAALLYIPANLYPVMYTTSLGQAAPQTIGAGVLYLAQTGDLPIAAIIFIASIVVPISKIVSLGWLCMAAGRRPDKSHKRTRAYRITEKIGRWSMIDVFVVSVLATLVQAGQLMSIEPGPGVLAFAAVVVLTMVAALTFDPRPLWPSIGTGYTHPHE